MKSVLLFLVGLVIYAFSRAQPYEGSIGSGFSYEKNLYCDTSNVRLYFSKGDSASGGNHNWNYYCDTLNHYFAFNGDSMSGGFVNRNLYCDTLNVRLYFSQGDSMSGGFHNVNFYCDTLNHYFAFNGDSMSGGFVNRNLYCDTLNVRLYFSQGDSMSGGFVNTIAYCTYPPYYGQIASGYGYVIGNCLVPLPVKILDFQAVKNQNTALIYWYVSEELNTFYYQVLKSVNGKDFSPLQEIKALNEDLPVTYYSMVDSAPVKGLNYYQLLSIDYDGNATFSDVRILDFSNQESGLPGLWIYPNPVQGSGELTVVNLTQESGNLALYDATGREIFLYSLPQSEPPVPFKVLLDISPGVYILVFQGETQIYHSRIVIY